MWFCRRQGEKSGVRAQGCLRLTGTRAEDARAGTGLCRRQQKIPYRLCAERPPDTPRPTLMIASKNIAGCPHSELKKIVVTLVAIAAWPNV